MQEDERLAASEPARARRMVSESRDLVARTVDAVAQSRKLLDRHRHEAASPAGPASPAERARAARARET